MTATERIVAPSSGTFTAVCEAINTALAQAEGQPRRQTDWEPWVQSLVTGLLSMETPDGIRKSILLVYRVGELCRFLNVKLPDVVLWALYERADSLLCGGGRPIRPLD